MADRVVLTYGTFDLFHIGHLRLLERLAALGDSLVVAVSTDEFNEGKGKRSLIPYEHRAAIVGSLKVVDKVIPETHWEQKRTDVVEHGVSVLGMGSDWEGKFDDVVGDLCEVVYLPRTEGVSSTALRGSIRPFSAEEISAVKGALDAMNDVLSRLS